ncbi:MaoC/PaaZ C-terminal domain-containing protein [Ancylobacter oerskovii]|uniref:MaoC/PaaZ C-terminal domain-containing protein n=1 Tax=Ancylobacter oerskovii TaxID=459519 RepID=A0ABW4Z473_9HYPH|nr:MaoC/PaaZ C-terminal domain-containing protein [Ancylobacter oerskovii]MBS7545779.1 dehydratase [Ancylobacter oerskovii]
MDFFEDVVVGTVTPLGSHSFFAEEITAFARSFDPQPFHLDAAVGARMHFGGLAASGWHTAAVAARLRAQAIARHHAELHRQGRPVPRIGPSPGFKNLKWLRPVLAGDTVTFASEVIAKKPSASRPEWGLVFTHETGTDQFGRPVFALDDCVFVEREES